MPQSSTKNTLWHSVNMLLACTVEIATYLEAVIRLMPDPPPEIVERLQQIQEILPCKMNLQSEKYTKTELEQVGIIPPEEAVNNGQS